MKHKSLTLENVNVHYDTKNAAIILTSKDPAIKGKPFQIKLSADTPTYGTLLELLASQDLVDLQATQISRFIQIPSAQETNSAKKEYKTRIRFGETFNDEPVELDLKHSPHTLIAGPPGSGKTVLQRLVAAHALAHPDEIELYGIDLKRVELSPYFPSTREKLATTFDEALALLGGLEETLEERYKILELLGANTVHKTTLKVIYLIVDELSLLVGKSGVENEEGRLEDAKRLIIQDRLEKLASLGRAAGIYLFIGTKRPEDKLLSGTFNANLSTRILTGISSASDAHYTLKTPLKFGGALLRNNGRAIVEIYGEQKLVQTYYLAPEGI